MKVYNIALWVKNSKGEEYRVDLRVEAETKSEAKSEAVNQISDSETVVKTINIEEAY